MVSVWYSIRRLLAIAFVCQLTLAFNHRSKSNVVNYWGQNSVSYSGGSEEGLAEYCKDDTIDILVIAFVSKIQNGVPVLSLANHCSGTFPGTSLLRCPEIGQDIKACQARGKAVLISIGGASGSYSLPDAQSGKAFADQMWDIFLGGSSTTRPFGDAILDGVDLDLESGQNAGYVAFVQSLRDKFASAATAAAVESSRNYYITAAPQCPYPDKATEDALASSWFDFVWVQFYNNYCGVQNFGSSNFNFETWNRWATTISLNKDVKILLGVPGGPGAAGSGVIDAEQLVRILSSVRSYSNFGGVMMWDAGVARKSNLASVASKFLHALPALSSPPLSHPTRKMHPSKTVTSSIRTMTRSKNTRITPASRVGSIRLVAVANATTTLASRVPARGTPIILSIHKENSTSGDHSLERFRRKPPTVTDRMGRFYKIPRIRTTVPSTPLPTPLLLLDF
ncbi:Chitinase 1 [Mortierella sp. AM989]|nr:Chitinase 1 [Mortierella sp. AM989]